MLRLVGVFWLLWLLFLMLSSPLSAESSLDYLRGGSIGSERGALSIADALKEPWQSVTTVETPIWLQLDQSRLIGNIPAHREVVVIALSEPPSRGLVKVRAQARHGGVSGWVAAKHVQGMTPKVIAKLQEVHKRYVAVSALIKKKQVAIGMTEAEVIASRGEPDKRSRKLTKKGERSSLQYVTYEKVAEQIPWRDSWGRYYHRTRYVKVITGKLVLHIRNGAVHSIEETEGNPLKEMGLAGIRRVVRPIVFR